jgi:hypothetical protein
MLRSGHDQAGSSSEPAARLDAGVKPITSTRRVVSEFFRVMVRDAKARPDWRRSSPNAVF